MTIIKTILFLLVSSLFYGCGGGATKSPKSNLIEEKPKTPKPIEEKKPKTEPEPEPKINNKPIATIENKPVEKMIRKEGISIEFLGEAYDEDNDELSFEWKENGTILATTKNFIKDDFTVGEHNITFTVTDAHGESVSDTITVRIVQSNNKNDAPEAIDQNIVTDEDVAVNFILNANDIDGDELTLSITKQPSSGNIEGTFPNLTYTPNKNFRGNDELTYTVNDGNQTSNEATVYVLVKKVNDAPTVNAGADKEVRAGHDIWISGTADDNDGDIVKYQWKEGAELLAETPTFKYTPKTVGNHELTLTVTDNEDATTSDSVIINATNKLALVVIQVEFDNYQIHSSSSIWSSKIFGTNEGELNHYYNEISYGRLQFEKAKESQGVANDGIIKITLDEDHPTNSVDLQTFLPRMIELSDSYINYAQYDTNDDKSISKDELQIMFLIAGGENATGLYPGVWAHQYCIYENTIADETKLMSCYNGGNYSIFGESHFSHGTDATIGIIAHELGHSALGLIDLYDTDGDSEGIGNFGLMGSGNWGRKSQNEKPGTTPIHMLAWNKIESKFIEPIEITEDKSIELINTMATNHKPYKIRTNHDSEYFLLENRANSGYDRGLFTLENGQNFQGGLLITHIDEEIDDNNNAHHKKVDVEEANNKGLDNNTTHRGHVNNLYFSGNKDNFTPTTSPNSNLYDGSNSGISITNISDTGASMSADIEIQ